MPLPTDGLIQNNFQGGQTSFVKNNQEDVKVDLHSGQRQQVQRLLFAGHGPRWLHRADPGIFPVAERLSDSRRRCQLGSHLLIDDRQRSSHWDSRAYAGTTAFPTDPSGQFRPDRRSESRNSVRWHQLYPGFSGQSISNNASYLGTNANTQILRDNTFNYYDNLTWQTRTALPFHWCASDSLPAELSECIQLRIPGTRSSTPAFSRASEWRRIRPGGLCSRSRGQQSDRIHCRYRGQPPVARCRIHSGRLQGHFEDSP